MEKKIQKKSPIKQRILQYIEILGISKREFYKKIDVSRGTLESDSGITEDIMAKFITTFEEISPEWLITGTGEMFKKNVNQDVQDLASVSENAGTETAKNQYKNTKNINTKNLIPLYSDVVSVGGNNDLSADMGANSQSMEYIDTGDWFKDATAAIRHYGDSMKEYPPGCILAIKEIKEKQLIVWGEDYVIETNEYRITKCIQCGNGGDCLIAYSSNNETYPDGRLKHEPLTISWADIRKIFLVLGYVVKKNGGTVVYSGKR